MNVVFSVDIEGASGIVSPKEIFEGGIDFEEGRRLLTGDVNAAVQGALDAGATEVVVHDSHGLDQRNILIEELHPEAVIVRGTPVLFFEGLRPEFDACCVIGSHSSCDEPRGVLNHVFSSKLFRSASINGTPVNENILTAAICAHHGIPTVLVTGDDVVCEETTRVLPGVRTVAVKEALSRFAARCLPLAKTHDMIRQGTRDALSAIDRTVLDDVRGLLGDEITLRIELASTYNAATIADVIGCELAAASTLEFRLANAMEVFRSMRLVLYCATSAILPG